MKLRNHKSLFLPAALVLLIALMNAPPLWAAAPTASQWENVQGVERVGLVLGPWVATLWDALRGAWGADEAGPRIDLDGLSIVPLEEGGTQAQTTEDPESGTTERGPNINIDG